MGRASSTFDKHGNVAEWFGEVIFETAEACGIKITEARVRVYAADLGDLEPQDITAAFRRCRREGSGFFPSVAEVRRQVVATPDDRALLAWNALEQAAASIGAYQSIEFEDPVAAAALVQVFGSWPQWCGMEAGPELALKRQQYLAAYRDLLRQETAGTDPVRLSGLLEATGKYQRLPQLAVGRITAGGVVQSVTEALQAKLDEVKQARQLPQSNKGADDGES